MITLDASLLIAHLNPRDAHHQAATDLLREAGARTLLIHSINLAEILVAGVKVDRGQEMLEDLRTMGVTVADRVDGEAMRLARLRVETRLKLPDCCALDAAMTTGSTLATFDRALADAARSHRLAVVPENM